MTRKVIVPLIAALAWTALAAGAGAVLTKIELKSGQKLVLNNGKSVVVKGEGAVRVFGIVGPSMLGATPTTHWFPRGATLVRDSSSMVFIHIKTKNQRLGTFQRIEGLPAVQLPAVQRRKVMQPTATAGGTAPEATSRARTQAPASLPLTRLTLKPGHRLALTNHKSVVAKGAGASQVFGVIGNDGRIRWFPRGAQLLHDARGEIFIKTNGRTQPVGQSATSLHEREVVSLNYRPVRVTPKPAHSSATDEWPASGSGAAQENATKARRAKRGAISAQIEALERRWPLFSARMKQLQRTIPNNKKTSTVVRQMNAEMASIEKSLHGARSILDKGNPSQMSALARSLDDRVARLLRLRKLLLGLRGTNNGGELLHMDLQNTLQEQQQTLQALSNLSKAFHDAAKAIIQNMKG